MKKQIAAFLAIGCIFMCTACKPNSVDSSNSSNTSDVEEDWVPPVVSTEKLFPIATDAVKGGELYFVKDGKSEYKIVLAENCSDVEAYAASFLYNIVKDATGAKITTVKDTAVTSFEQGDYYISIGETSLLKNYSTAADETKVSDNGFVLSLQGNSVFIDGGDNMGTLYGVQEFLTYLLDFEVYTVDEVYYNKISNVAMVNFGEQEIRPSILYCSPGALQAEDLEDAALLRSVSRRKGYATLDGAKWSTNMIAHSLEALLPKSEYGEWYNNGQICYSIDEAITVLAEKSAQIIRNSSEDDIYFQLGNADSNKACSCVDCKKEAQENGGFGGSYVIWLNKIAAQIEKIFEEEGFTREWYLLGLMYQAYEAAPVVLNSETGKYEPLNENVICGEHVGVQYCPINVCYSHPMTQECNINTVMKAEQNLYGWAALTDTYLLWTYDTDFYNFFFFFDDFGSLAGNIKSYAELGAEAVYYQMSNNYSSPFDKLRTYLIKELSWDATQNYQVLMNNFFTNYYKEAAPYMKEYFDAIQAQIMVVGQQLENDGCLVYYNGAGQYSHVKYWSYDLLQSYEAIIEKAYKAINDAGYDAEEAEKMRLRIRADEMFCTDFFVRYYRPYFSDEEYNALKEAYYADNALLGNSWSGEGVKL